MTVVPVLLFAIGTGLVFYFMRCREPLVYGLVEVVVGMAIVVVTFFPQTPQITWLNPTWGASLPKLIGFSAGVYVMVRGLDNIERGLGDFSPTVRRTWRRVFYGEASDTEG